MRQIAEGGAVAGALALGELKLAAGGSMALAIAFQMWPALLGICYVPWFTRRAVISGLVFGIGAVVLTGDTGALLAQAAGLKLPFDPWPLGFHAAAWGIGVNLLVVLTLSAATQDEADFAHKTGFHTVLVKGTSLPPARRALVPLAWTLVMIWFFFAVGPGLVIGNAAFGAGADRTAWLFGIPSLWAWQLIWWALGVFMMWFLAYKMEMATKAAPVREAEGRIVAE